jgi:hypothetical protein
MQECAGTVGFPLRTHGGHWVTVLVSFASFEIYLWDSGHERGWWDQFLGNSQLTPERFEKSTFQQLWLIREWLIDNDFGEEWKIRNVRKVPKQRGGWECGWFTLGRLLNLADNKPITDWVEGDIEGMRVGTWGVLRRKFLNRSNPPGYLDNLTAVIRRCQAPSDGQALWQITDCQWDLGQ